MRKLLAKFGFVPASHLDSVRQELESVVQNNAALREQVYQLLGDSARHKEAHEELKVRHEQQQRAAVKLNQALSGKIPIMFNANQKRK